MVACAPTDSRHDSVKSVIGRDGVERQGTAHAGDETSNHAGQQSAVSLVLAYWGCLLWMWREAPGCLGSTTLEAGARPANLRMAFSPGQHRTQTALYHEAPLNREVAPLRLQALAKLC